MKNLILLFALLITQTGICQSSFYDVNPGDGNGLRFWGATGTYKISMGASAPEYRYGPVNGYSIKSNMQNVAGWGWSWGSEFSAPIAALNTQGQMQIAGSFKSLSLSFGNTIDSRKLALWEDAGQSFYGFGIQSDQFRIQAGTSARISFLSGDSNEIVTFRNSGNVGIGTISPSAKLQVEGLGGANVDIRVNGRILTGDVSNYGGILIGSSGSMFFGQLSASSMGIYNNGAWRLVSDPSGNIGIGTMAPDQKLTVNGIIHAKEVRVDLTGFAPDYVFESSYKLRPLSEVGSYIEENKHLPEVPSAAEIEKNGINVSEMNMLLLKKIEELTLYIIEIKKEQSIQTKEMQLQIDQLKERK